jgi:Zn-dependent protease
MASWRIGRAYGINIYLHWSMLLLPLWILLTQPSAVVGFSLALTTALFGCVVLHELGHALTARRFGIGTRDITLYPIGGVARLESTGNRPWEELCIALAGPAVNVTIALGLGLAWWTLPPGESLLPFGQFLYWLIVLNVGMVVFNLLPAFPLDGGRVFRALLAMPLGQLRATRIAAGVAVVLAVLIGVVGFVYNPWLVLIAMFIFLAGQQELQAVELRHRLRTEGWTPFAFRSSRQTWDAEHPWTSPDSSSAAPDPHTDPVWRPRVIVHVWDAEKQQWVGQ